MVIENRWGYDWIKIYVYDNKDDNLFLDCSSASIICSKEELNNLIDGLVKFCFKIENYVNEHPNESTLEKTYMHYVDINKICEKSENDFIFIVDMDSDRE